MYKTIIEKMKNNTIAKWAIARTTERTTLDGAVLIAAGVSYFLFKPVFSIVAIAAILYGIWTVLTPN